MIIPATPTRAFYARCFAGLVLVFLGIINQRVAAQGAQLLPRELSGVVTSAGGRPVAAADVTLLGMGGAATDSSGAFSFRGVPPGIYIVRVQKLGFAPMMRSIVMDASAGRYLTLQFDHGSTLLAPVIIRDSAVRRYPDGFADRRRNTQGIFLDEGDIAARHAQRVEHLLAQLPGVQVDTAGIVRIDRGRTSIYGDNCQAGVQLFVDGVAVAPDFTLRNLSPDALRGLEVYRGGATVPATLHSARMACGTVAIWTK